MWWSARQKNDQWRTISGCSCRKSSSLRKIMSGSLWNGHKGSRPRMKKSQTYKEIPRKCRHNWAGRTKVRRIRARRSRKTLLRKILKEGTMLSLANRRVAALWAQANKPQNSPPSIWTSFRKFQHNKDPPSKMIQILLRSKDSKNW